MRDRLCGYHPFPQHDDVLLRQNTLRGVFDFKGDSWADKSEEAKDFISRLLCVDPAQRMTARQVGVYVLGIKERPWRIVG